MPLFPSVADLTIRLALAFCACALIGLNRGARGRAAGLRTTILVGLAACVSMIQMNLLLPLSGKTAESFAVMDLMRLPLGILTGVGFIGGGAILKRGDLVTGVTTAATLWIVTVIGLCFGGGQIALGLVATVLSLITLWLLRWVDTRIPREQHARLILGTTDLSTIGALETDLRPLGFNASFTELKRDPKEDVVHLTFDVTWSRGDHAGPPLDLAGFLASRYQVELFELPAGMAE